jgi:hypothetical protein
MPTRSFSDYKDLDIHWDYVTLSTGDYYPDILQDACNLYMPVIQHFKRLLDQSNTSGELFLLISRETNQSGRVQLQRLFRKYVAPDLPVEMLKKKTWAGRIADHFGEQFRPIEEVKRAFNSRCIPDEALCAVLWEYKDRGKEGYDLTESFFNLFRTQFPNLPLIGPERAGRDVLMGEIFPDYPNPNRPVDFIIYDVNRTTVLAVGLARYDSDRGGAQEDDRTGGYHNCAREILDYASTHGLDTKVIFLNEGPGLLLGSMWNDYSSLEAEWPGKVMVTTLKMIPERLTEDWLRS